MELINILVGVALGCFGRRLFWLFVAGVGFVTGMKLAPEWLGAKAGLVTALTAMAVGVIVVILSVFLQRVAAAIARDSRHRESRTSGPFLHSAKCIDNRSGFLLTTRRTPAETMKEQRWLRIIPVALIMYTISYVDRTNVALALDPNISSMMRDLAMTDKLKGLAGGIFFFGYVLLQIPGGHLASHWNARKVIGILL